MNENHRPIVRVPLATAAELAREPSAFPSTTDVMPCEAGFADWRERLTRNLSRRSDGRWDPLTLVHEERINTAPDCVVAHVCREAESP